MQEFINMGGYAFYVWSSFGLGVLSVVYLYSAAKSSNEKKIKQVRAWIARQNAQLKH